jgi:hypothetical protein
VLARRLPATGAAGLQLAAQAARRAAGAPRAGGQPAVGGKPAGDSSLSSPPQGALPEATARCRRGRFPLLPDKWGHEARTWEVLPKGRSSTNEPCSCWPAFTV